MKRKNKLGGIKETPRQINFLYFSVWKIRIRNAKRMLEIILQHKSINKTKRVFAWENKSN